MCRKAVVLFLALSLLTLPAASQELTANKDGSITIEARASSYMEIIPNLMRWMPMVTVVSPKELKDEVRKKITAYLKKI